MSDSNILRCLTCTLYTSRIEATQRVFLTGKCAHCGGGELIPDRYYHLVRRVDELRSDAGAMWGRIRAAALRGTL